jgi:hypothetical protein
MLHFAFLPMWLMYGLRYAFFEKHIGHMLLEAVPLSRLEEAMERATGDGRDDITEASQLPRGASFADIKELMGGADAGVAAKDAASPADANTPQMSKTFRMRPRSNLYKVFAAWAPNGSARKAASMKPPSTSLWSKMWCNKKSSNCTMCPTELSALRDLQLAAESEDIFRKYRLQLYLFSGLLVLAELALVIVLPILYTNAALYLREFQAIGQYVTVFAETLFTISLYRGQVGHVPTGVVDPSFPKWYDYYGINGLNKMQDLATHLEYLHRCVVYGCTDLNIKGVQISPTLTDYFYGSGGVDKTLKRFVQDIRAVSLDNVFAAYSPAAHALSRLLPKLYVDNFAQWAQQYTLVIVICCCVVIGAVLFVTIRYYKRFVMQFSRDVRLYRFVLKLLPDDAIEELPYARSYLASSAWVEDPHWEVPAEQLMGEQEEDAQM